MRSHLFCRVNGRSAEYVLELAKVGEGYVVNYQYGKIGSNLRPGTHKETKQPVDWTKAASVYNRVLREKVSEGYRGDGQDSFAGEEQDVVVSNGAGEVDQTEAAESPVETPATQRPMTFGVGETYDCELLSEISEAEALRYIRSDDFLAQLKANGDRRAVRKFANGKLFGVNRKGQLTPLPQEIAEAFAGLDAQSFLIDGELLHDPGVLDHTVVWDVLELNGDDLRQKSYDERLAILQGLVGEDTSGISLVPTWDGTLAKTQAVIELHKKDCEGVVFKRRNASWKAGKANQHFKLKFWKTCTVRICKKTAKAHLNHNSAAIELFDEQRKRWTPVGHYSLNGKPEAEIGRLAEVRYLYFDRSGLYGPVEFLRFRDDLDESAAAFSQVRRKAKREDVA